MFAGVDSHKDTLAAAVIDSTGRVLDRVQVANREDGFARLLDLVSAHRVERVGIEGSGGYGWPAALWLLEHGVAVVEVPPALTARERSSRPGQGKTDPGDAVAIARITAREDSLPAVRAMSGVAADLRILTDYRDQLVAERTATANRVHVDLLWLHPGYQDRLQHLTTRTDLRAAEALLGDDTSVRATITRGRLRRMVELNDQIEELKTQIDALVAASGSSLTQIYGVGPLVAATILGRVGDARRYPTRHHFATANGTAPIPASSGRTVRHRLNRCGDRQLNRVLYVMAITQLRGDTEGRAYYQRKRAEGKTSREALRCLKRRLSDLIYRTLRADQAHADQTEAAAA
ncbi:IS110 family RNA-guided transposase [Microlunatus flavus]|uniref:IS110 family transposase n=1 Tax=Microlunatus flavus TaxID=1036181 RepID=UPI000B81D26A|nr:IS110 family transposase [Microlunatus flavus]